MEEEEGSCYPVDVDGSVVLVRMTEPPTDEEVETLREYFKFYRAQRAAAVREEAGG